MSKSCPFTCRNFKSWSALLINQPNTKPCISYVPGFTTLSATSRSFEKLLKVYPLVKGGFLFEYNLPIRNFILINIDNKIDVFESYLTFFRCGKGLFFLTYIYQNVRLISDWILLNYVFLWVWITLNTPKLN